MKSKSKINNKIEVKTGCDIVKIDRFRNIKSNVLKKIFHKSELKNPKPETLAGIFAAKESCKKVFNDLNWLDVEVRKKRNGKPEIILYKSNIKNSDVSISHDGNYAIANVVFLLEK